MCHYLVDYTWNAHFLAEVGRRDKAACLDEDQQEDEENEEEGVTSKSVQPKLTIFRKAMQSLDDVAAFLDSKGCTSEATQVCHMKDVVRALSYTADNTRQSTTDDCFQ